MLTKTITSRHLTTANYRRGLRQAWAFNRWLTLAGLLHLALIPVLLFAWAVDPKTILDVPGWIKPLKFAISIGIYCFTLVWLLTYLQNWPRLVKFVTALTSLALTLEMVLITMQVVRGTASHFNVSTPFDALVFKTMGQIISLVALLNLLVGLVLLVQRLPDQVFAWSLRLGFLLSFAGMGVAVLMLNPTPAQRATMQAGQPRVTRGAHSVGIVDGGPGLPLLGWSTTGGDLRVPHFFGLHGLQVLPLVGWLLTRERSRRRLAEGQRLLLIGTAGLGYLGLIGILTWQALRAQSVIAPDRVTLIALGTLVGAMLLVLVSVAMRVFQAKPLVVYHSANT